MSREHAEMGSVQALRRQSPLMYRGLRQQGNKASGAVAPMKFLSHQRSSFVRGDRLAKVLLAAGLGGRATTALSESRNVPCRNEFLPCSLPPRPGFRVPPSGTTADWTPRQRLLPWDCDVAVGCSPPAILGPLPEINDGTLSPTVEKYPGHAVHGLKSSSFRSIRFQAFAP